MANGDPFKPNFYKGWFWDFDYDRIDWQASYKSIGRIIERGDKQDWEELIEFYGRDKVINALKNEILFLPDYAIESVCQYFPIRKEEMQCFTRKQSRPEHWI